MPLHRCAEHQATCCFKSSSIVLRDRFKNLTVRPFSCAADFGKALASRTPVTILDGCCTKIEIVLTDLAMQSSVARYANSRAGSSDEARTSHSEEKMRKALATQGTLVEVQHEDKSVSWCGAPR